MNGVAAIASRIPVALALPLMLLAGCGGGGGGPNLVTVGGTVSGLAGSGLVLTNNGGDQIAPSGNGSFTFTEKIPAGSAYSVSVQTQPTTPSQTCAIDGASGRAGDHNVTTVAVTCTTNLFTVGGSISGLPAGFRFGFTLQLHSHDTQYLNASTNEAFTFLVPLASGSPYTVVSTGMPYAANETCSVSNGSGVVAGSNITNIAVVCTPNTYTLGGTVSGLTGPQLVLSENDYDFIVLNGNGPFTSPTLYGSGETYAVTVNQPTGDFPSQTCSITNGTGMFANSNVTNIVISCTATAFAVGGTVSGLSGSGLVLRDNGGDDLGVPTNGTFAFLHPVASGTTYSVSVFQQPTNPTQNCYATKESGIVGTGPVTSVVVNCNPRIYTVGGTVSGLTGSGLVLAHNAGDTLNVSANGAFAFPTPAATGDSYLLTIATQPTNPAQNCVATNTSGAVASANVTTITVTCANVGRYLYAAGDHENAVLAYSIDPVGGALTAIAGSPYPAGDSTSAITVDRALKFLYAANQGATGGVGSNTISAYTIDFATGVLSAVPGSPFASVAAPISIAVEHSGRFAYVANNHDNTVSAFAIDAATGALAPIMGGLFVAGLDGPRHITVHPAGDFLYLSVANENAIWEYSIDGTTGALTLSAGSPLTTPSYNGMPLVPAAVVIDAIRSCAYVGGTYGGMFAYAINSTTGALVNSGECSGASRNSITTAEVTASSSFAIFPSEAFSFVYSQVPDYWQFPTVHRNYPGSIAIDPSGRFLYGGDADGNAWALKIDVNTGTLTLSATSPSVFAQKSSFIMTK